MDGEDERYLVFGAYGGIGSELVRHLTSSGARVAVSGRDSGRLEALAEETGAVWRAADAADFEQVEDVMVWAARELGSVDGVAHCVGSVLLKPAHLTREAEWEQTLATNLTSAFAVLRAAVAVMVKQEAGGSIVLVSTAAATIGLPNHEAIAAAKGGIDALVRSAAATYGSRGVRVNSVAPGLVATPMTARITGNEQALERSRAMHALGRIGAATDVATAMHWLLSPRTGWITGQTLGVDGGLGRVRSE